MYTRADDFFYFSGIEKKAAKQVWLKFQLNRYELNMLASLSAYLQLHDKRIISREIFSNWLGVGFRVEKKCYNYLHGLVNKGAIHRLAYRRPDGNSLAISAHGIRILEYFFEIIEHQEHADRARKKGPGYKDLAIDINNLPHGYILKQAGRES